ncbi:hypothetical protein [Micromonospora sp. WMMD980]|uniref:hypothetical protein n=1 Tax=Micromonospora sp. WMMD980 TaxID=3016088 RepID=UPI002415A654|nr:hypothetical protein [Micromonospora sp. WMMD980]MDG4801701.1 hypothetical protein [Micromonospora sp. WMMD980]
MRLAQLDIADEFDGDDDLRITPDGRYNVYLHRDEVRELRDHLSGLLGEAPPVAPKALADAVRRVGDEMLTEGNALAARPFVRLAALLDEGRL